MIEYHTRVLWEARVRVQALGVHRKHSDSCVRIPALPFTNYVNFLSQILLNCKVGMDNKYLPNKFWED